MDFLLSKQNLLLKKRKVLSIFLGRASYFQNTEINEVTNSNMHINTFSTEHCSAKALTMTELKERLIALTSPKEINNHPTIPI